MKNFFAITITIIVLLLVYLLILQLWKKENIEQITRGEEGTKRNKEVNVVGFVDKMDKDGCFSIASMLMYDYIPNIYTLDFKVNKNDKEGELIKEAAWHLQLINKMKIYAHYCNRKDMKKDDLIILSDIQDVAYMRSASKFYEKFQQIKNDTKKYVFLSAFDELNPFGHSLFSKCPLSRERARKMYQNLGNEQKGQFINGGLLTGEFKKVCRFLSVSKYIQQFFGEECGDEQLIFALTYFFENDWVGLDNWDFFAGPSTDSEIIEKKFPKKNLVVKMKDKNNYIFAHHGSGRFKSHFLMREKMFNKNFTEIVKNKLLFLNEKEVSYSSICGSFVDIEKYDWKAEEERSRKRTLQDRERQRHVNEDLHPL